MIFHSPIGQETAMESMLISCPECDTRMKVPEATIGKKVRCKKCEHIFVVALPKKSAPVREEEDEDEDRIEKPAKKPARPDAIQQNRSEKPASGRPAPSAKSGRPESNPKPSKPAKPAEEGEGAFKLAPEPGSDTADDGRAYGVTHESDGFRCPQCAADMEGPEAVICLNCGFNTRTRAQSRTRKLKDITGHDKFMWRLPGIICAVSILLLIGYWCFHHFALIDMMIDDFDKTLDAKGGDRRLALDDEQIPWYGMLFKPWFELWMGIGFGFASFALGKFAFTRLVLHPDPPEVELS